MVNASRNSPLRNVVPQHPLFPLIVEAKALMHLAWPKATAFEQATTFLVLAAEKKIEQVLKRKINHSSDLTLWHSV